MQGFDHATHSCIVQFAKMLRNLDAWLGRGVDHAKAKSFDPDVLLTLRLAPDMFALVRQVQSACDTAKLAAARMADKEAPAHPDSEATVAQLRERIAAVAAYLDGFTVADFAHAAERKISLPWMKGQWTPGSAYFLEFAIPNFYFHVNMAYAILRGAGVELGKTVYIGSLPLHGM
ncbi:MAG: DUF1993 domain-containing protein [Nannocystaceae bacterium]|nr:DUF1993 domain-containing protein [Nannocystaceae bacterium]